MNSPAVAVFGIQPSLLALAHAASYADLELRGIWSPDHSQTLKFALLLGTSAFPDPVRLFDSLDSRALVICAEEHIGELRAHRALAADPPYSLIVGLPGREASVSPPQADEGGYFLRLLDPETFPLDRVPSAPLPLRASSKPEPTPRAQTWLELLRVKLEEK